MANNIAYGNGLSGINSNDSDRIDMFYNTAYQNTRSRSGNNAGISCNDSKSCNVKNNIAVSINDYGGFAFNSRFDDLQRDEIVFANNIAVGQVKPTLPSQIMFDTTEDLSFEKIDDFDFHLKKCSPAVNIGDTFLDVSTDFDGNPRGDAPDLGALEYIGPSCDVPTTSAPNPSSSPATSIWYEDNFSTGWGEFQNEGVDEVKIIKNTISCPQGEYCLRLGNTNKARAMVKTNNFVSDRS